MTLDPRLLAGVRKAIRKFLVIADEDPVDIVVLASVIANFAPDRIDPVWLALIAPPGHGKTELVSLFANWRPVWRLPDRLSAAYFVSSRSGRASALFRADRAKKRIMLLGDMGTLDAINLAFRQDLYVQMLNIHDGMLSCETGLVAKPLVYGPKAPADRMGFIGTWTERFYPAQSYWLQLGARILAYYWWSPKKNWDDYSHLIAVNRAHAERARYQPVAQDAVISLLDAAIRPENIGTITDITFPPGFDQRVAAAATLVGRCIGQGTNDDSGARLNSRIRQIARAAAYLAGRSAVTDLEASIAMRLVLSQLPPLRLKILQFAVTWRRPSFRRGDILPAIGATRRTLEPHIEALSDVEILIRRRAGQTEFRYALATQARQLLAMIDPDGLLWAPPHEQRTTIADTPISELAPASATPASMRPRDTSPPPQEEEEFVF